jgi:hypothetical protein
VSYVYDGALVTRTSWTGPVSRNVVAFDTAIGAATGRAFGASNMSGGVRRGSAGHVYKSMRTALKNGTISSIRPATGVKMFRGALEEHQIPLGMVIGVVTLFCAAS